MVNEYFSTTFFRTFKNLLFYKGVSYKAYNIICRLTSSVRMLYFSTVVHASKKKKILYSVKDLHVF